MVEVIPRESEEQWLGERQTRTTATDIARLANSGPAGWASVKAEKNGARTFFGNRYTEWGHEREPLIVSHLTFLYGIEPNDALYVNGSRAATPDGVGADCLAEVKTTVRPWADLAALRSNQPKYYDQSLWAQAVAEMDKTVFAFEPHENFIPGEVQHFEIPRDEERLAELYEVEQHFLEYLHTEQQQGEWDAFMATYYEADALMKEAVARVEALKVEFREKAGDREIAAKTPFGSISYATPKPSERVASFKDIAEADADLAGRLRELSLIKKSVPTKPTLRITPRG